MAKVKFSMSLYKQRKGNYPTPDNKFLLMLTGETVAYQGKLNEHVPLSTLDTLPTDPKTKGAYTYSVTANKREFQLAGTLENGVRPIAILVGDYKTVSKNLIPTISVATSYDIELTTDTTKFIFDAGEHNLPYTIDSPYNPFSDNTSLSNLLIDPTINFWQNSDYSTCYEIKEAAKSIGDGEYQILDTNGVLTSTDCTSM
ncbi:MAG: hypothetical protein GY828_00375 [Candidatus Gracilibacteria bacterium]|nr:hypothetical protein [Candidatus Gracilibacteria bacterium]